MVAATVTAGTLRAFGSYWNRVVKEWGDRRIDASRPSEIETLRAKVQASIAVRANSRGGRSAAENLIRIRHVSGPLRTLIP